jgi:hydroxyethylthiazole kinase
MTTSSPSDYRPSATTDAAANVALAPVVDAVRTRAPLVQCITNYVSMDLAANVLNAAGASPAMVHDAAEAAEFARLADAVVVNIGTPSPSWVEGMLAASLAARDNGTRWIFDPVAVGATTYRHTIAEQLLDHRPAVIRGNAGEILALSGVAGASRGVDSAPGAEQVGDHAAALASRLGCVVAVTGSADLVTDGERHLVIEGGDPRAVQITALGCALTGLVAACCAVADDGLAGTAAALAMMTVALERAGDQARGPGSLRWHLLDELSTLSGADVTGAAVRS